ncbi:Uu.00g132380.m01.CDS01 [Anthostomella pinea]|uniref:Uu.00g132380.m01.CDS01 n=1 Tax=Anthostomella pinea TaxID=933095 RepID=A0AAI8VK69_9PEZI|nr:Uu.00g132380.m01.CDS01 [Anthostomella pinea]
MPGVTASSAHGRSREPAGHGGHLAGCIKWLPHKEKLTVVDAEIDDNIVRRPRSREQTPQQPKNEAWLFAHRTVQPTPGQWEAAASSRPIGADEEDFVCEHGITAVYSVEVVGPYDRRGPGYFLSPSSYQELIDFPAPSPHPLSHTLPSEHLLPARIDNNLRQDATPSSATYTTRLEIAREYERRHGTLRQPHVEHQARGPRSTAYSHTHHRNERQSLLPISNDYPPLSYGTYSTSPRPIVIRGSYEGPPTEPFDRGKFWKRVKMAVWILAALSVSYGTYRGVCWTVDVVKSAVAWCKDGVRVEDKAGDLWLSVTKAFRSLNLV